VRSARCQLARRSQPLGAVEAAQARPLLAHERGVLQRQGRLVGHLHEEVAPLAVEGTLPTDQQEAGQAIHRYQRESRMGTARRELIPLLLIEIFDHAGLFRQDQRLLVDAQPAHQTRSFFPAQQLRGVLVEAARLSQLVASCNRIVQNDGQAFEVEDVAELCGDHRV